MTSSAPESPAAGAALAPRARARFNPGWGLVILGGLLGVLAAFLTWATVDYGVAAHTYSGVSGGRDGKITLVLSVLVLAVTAQAFVGWVRTWLRATLLVLGLLIAFVAVADLAASPGVGSEETVRLHTSVRITSSNGIGEWLTLIAGVLIVIGVVLVARYSRPRVAGAHSRHSNSANVEQVPPDADAG